MSIGDGEQQVAEEIDPDEIGDDPEGNLDFPPDEPVGVDDPTRDDRVTDSIRERADREVPEDEPGRELEGGQRLVAPNDVEADDEATAIATAVDASDLSAEEAAVHPID